MSKNNSKTTTTMPTSTPRLYDLNGERYDLSVNIFFSPTAFVPECYMVEMTDAEKDKIDKNIIDTRRKVYGAGAHPDRVDVVALANRGASKVMYIRRAIALTATATPSTPSTPSTPPSPSIPSSPSSHRPRLPRSPLLPQEILAPASSRHRFRRTRERKRQKNYRLYL